jgi:hypothetical protein
VFAKENFGPGVTGQSIAVLNAESGFITEKARNGDTKRCGEILMPLTRKVSALLQCQGLRDKEKAGHNRVSGILLLNKPEQALGFSHSS